jgi:hypothetical protein
MVYLWMPTKVITSGQQNRDAILCVFVIIYFIHGDTKETQSIASLQAKGPRKIRGPFA